MKQTRRRLALQVRQAIRPLFFLVASNEVARFHSYLTHLRLLQESKRSSEVALYAVGEELLGKKEKLLIKSITREQELSSPPI
jgi:hypothetical protein